MVTLSVLISDLERELVRLGYKGSTLTWYRQCWRSLEGDFANQGIEEFDLEVAMAWVDAACDFFAKEQAGTLKQTDVYLFRVAQMLGDFVAHGAVLRRYDRRADKLTANQTELIGKFQAGLRAEGCAVSTVRTYGTLAGEFLSFVDGILQPTTHEAQSWRSCLDHRQVPGAHGRTRACPCQNKPSYSKA